MSANSRIRATRGCGAGLALATASLLALEIMLTRIFSVTMWYHFAFLAISVAMFGTALGAAVVHVRRDWFPDGDLPARMAWTSVALAVSIPAALIAHLSIPFVPLGTAAGFLSVVSTYAASLVPFTLGGIVVAIGLTRFPADTPRLYALDLVGAAAGCLGVFVAMGLLDGPSAVLAASLPAAAAGWAFDAGAHPDRRRRLALTIVTAALAALVGANALTGLVAVRWVKNPFGGAVPAKERGVEIELWNAMSRVVVLPGGTGALGWGLSPEARKRETRVSSKYLLIDNAAGTAMFSFDGSFEPLRFLGEDVTAVAYRGMPPAGRAVVLGVGGGKDILTALAAGASHVTGVEVNRNVVRLLRRDLAAFSGRLAERPDVRLVVDEGRSWLARSNERFDVIQASLIDSWAATAAGAFVLSETGLYTSEGWEVFLDHLTDDGVVTFSRWYVEAQPGETLRLVAVAAEALGRRGIRDASRHLFLAGAAPPGTPGSPPLGVATLIASRTPLDGGRLAAYRSACASLGFAVLHEPGRSATPEIDALLDAEKRPSFVAGYPLDLSPATDDRPFFFNMLKPLQAFAADTGVATITDFNLRAVRLVAGLFLALAGAAGLAIVLPLRLATSRSRAPAGASAAGILYFGGIGLGFMLVEMGQVQRLSLYLGHPTYGLVVVLAGMLASAGLGSLAGAKIVAQATRATALRAAGGFLVTLLLFILGTPAILDATEAWALPARIALAFALVGIPGFFMGIPFPLGIRAAEPELGDRLPWLWGINGAFSVVGSVLAMLLSIGWGIRLSMTVGLACYALALPLLRRLPR